MPFPIVQPVGNNDRAWKSCRRLDAKGRCVRGHTLLFFPSPFSRLRPWLPRSVLALITDFHLQWVYAEAAIIRFRLVPRCHPGLKQPIPVRVSRAADKKKRLCYPPDKFHALILNFTGRNFAVKAVCHRFKGDSSPSLTRNPSFSFPAREFSFGHACRIAHTDWASEVCISAANTLPVSLARHVGACRFPYLLIRTSASWLASPGSCTGGAVFMTGRTSHRP